LCVNASDIATKPIHENTARRGVRRPISQSTKSTRTTNRSSTNCRQVRNSTKYYTPATYTRANDNSEDWRETV